MHIIVCGKHLFTDVKSSQPSCHLLKREIFGSISKAPAGGDVCPRPKPELKENAHVIDQRAAAISEAPAEEGYFHWPGQKPTMMMRAVVRHGATSMPVTRRREMAGTAYGAVEKRSNSKRRRCWLASNLARSSIRHMSAYK